MKITASGRNLRHRTLNAYAKLCGWALAGACAFGRPALISVYLGNGDAFDKAIIRFAAAYSDQTESDHRAMSRAARDGRLEEVAAIE
jgi:hypothetical protein